MSVLLGNGDGTFQTAVSYDSGGLGALVAAVADVNGDGRPDIIVTNSCANSTSCANYGSGVIGVLLGNGDGTFQAAVTYDSGGYGPASVAVADLNEDSKPDMVVAQCSGPSYGCIPGEVGVLLNNGDGTFQNALNYGSGADFPQSVQVADVNGDGKPDLLVLNNGGGQGPGAVGVLLGNGDGSFQTAVTYGGVDNGFSLALGDLNGDGKLDLVVANASGGNCSAYDSPVGVLLGNGDGTFQTATYVCAGAEGPTSVAVGDLNGDGMPDVLVALNGGTTGEVGVLLNLALTTTTVTSSLNPSNFGQSVTFTATVTSQGHAGRPTGTATFYDGGSSFGNGSINSSGVATFTTSMLSAGTHNITATYSGDASFATSTSPVLSQSVQAFIALSPATVTFPGQYVGTSGLPQTVTLANPAGNGMLSITSVTAAPSSDFAATNSCNSSVPDGGNCSISVFFDPSASGTRTGILTVTDGAGNSPQTVSLAGTGQDFSLASGSFSATVSPGQTATYNLTVASSGGFN